MATTIPPPQDLTPSSRVSPKTVTEAVNALLKWKTEKTKTEKPQLMEQDEFVYLFTTLKKIPQKSRTNAHRIPIPHPLIQTQDSPEICLIIDDRTKSGLTKPDAKKKIKTENIPVTKVIKLSKLKSDYRPYESKRKLCDSYDMFFADRRILHLLPRVIGKKFFARKKIPLAIDLKHKNWKEQMEKSCGSAMFFMRTGTCSVIKVGKLSMEGEDIVENVMATLNGVVELLPGKWKYVRSLHLKLSESLALPIYQAVPDLKLKMNDGFESVLAADKEVKKVGSEVEKSVGKKKKGRIHEVRYMDSNVSEVLDDDEIGDAVVDEEVNKNKKRKKEVVESEKPVKKAAKGKLKEKATEVVEVAESEKPVKKAKAKTAEVVKVAESPKPVKKAVKGNAKAKAATEVVKVAESPKPVRKSTRGNAKAKAAEVVEVVESPKPVKKATNGKLNAKSKEVSKPAKAKVTKEESSGGSKPKRKSALRK